MRIVVVNNFFPPRVGGSSHLSESLATAFAAAGHEVLVITGSYMDAPLDEQRNGYRVIRMPGWALPRMRIAFNFDINFVSTPRNFKRLWAILDEFKPELIHQHGQFFDLTFLTAIYARRRKIPAVLSIHTRLEHPSRAANVLLAAADRTLVRGFLAIGKPHVVVMDKLMLSYIRRRYGVSDDRLVPIPVGVAVENHHSNRSVRSEFALDKGQVILSLGHVIPLRNRLALVDAMPRVLERHPNALVVVVGNPYETRFIERAEQIGVMENLRVVGGQPKADIAAFLAVASVEAHDLSGHGLGTANLEAMAAGVPVIAAVDEDNFPGISLRSWENIILVPPEDPKSLADAIVRVLDDPSAQERLVAAQRQLIRDHFSLESVASAHLELFGRLVGQA